MSRRNSRRHTVNIIKDKQDFAIEFLRNCVTTVSLTKKDTRKSAAQMPNVILFAGHQVLVRGTEGN